MRLLKFDDRGKIRLTDHKRDQIPCYAILSHTWGADDDEVTFDDLIEGKGQDKAGFAKISFCARQSAKDGLQYFWIDTCCIDKRNLTELSEAIALMFRWYQNAAKCYVYLSDVTAESCDNEDYQPTWEAAFQRSRWHKRGWTLQELIAPKFVEFFSAEGQRIGNKTSLEPHIHEITGIPREAIRGTTLSQFDVEERMRWARGRKTARKEDEAYCLQGIFGVFIPLIYGEGDNAFWRLQEEIDRSAKREQIEPPSKRRKTGSLVPEADDNPEVLSGKELLESLNFDQIDDRFDNIKQGLAKTCTWFLESKEYLDWLEADDLHDNHGILWVKGKPGSGKSTLVKFTFTEMKKSLQTTIFLSFFFNARGNQLEKSTIGLYRSLLVQLRRSHPECERVLDTITLTVRPRNDRFKTNGEMLKQMFAMAMQKLNHCDIIIIVDALDECDENEIRDMIAFFERLQEDVASENRKFRVLFSSRHYPHIKAKRSIKMTLEKQMGHFQDIDKYISTELKLERGQQAEKFRQEIRDRASGIFMWVVLVIQILNKASDRGQVHILQKKLQEIPDDLNELFRSILTRDREDLDTMKLCLQWILYAHRPLSREELYFAIMAGTASPENFSWNRDALSPRSIDLFILSSSKGLAEVTKSKKHTVQFIHESVRDYLLKEDGLSQVWNDLKVNTIGLSHDRLKDCCSNYIESNIAVNLGADGMLPRAKTSEAVYLREKALRTFPFLKYAVHFVFAHTDTSQAEGISQQRFLQNFDTRKWVQLKNICEQHEIRRYDRYIDLLYVLAEEECPNLVNVAVRDTPQTWRIRGRYNNPVFAAIAKDNHQVFEALVMRDTATYSRSSRCPLSSSVVAPFLRKYGTPVLTRRFLSIYDVNVHFQFKDGSTLLSWAAGKGDLELVTLLLRRRVHVNELGQCGSCDNGIVAASTHRHEKVMDFLFKKGLHPTVSLEKSFAALDSVTDRDHLEIIKMTLDGGLVNGMESERRFMILQSVALQGRKESLEFLLDRGFGSNLRSEEWSEEWSNLLFAALSSSHGEICKIMLDRGFGTALQKSQYDSMLLESSSRGYEKAVEALLDRGADVNAEDINGGTALEVASANGHEAIVKLLLDRGADVNNGGSVFGSALQAAAAQGKKRNSVESQKYDASTALTSVSKTVEPQDQSLEGNNSLRDYQVQLMLLEQQNKKRLLMARQDQDGRRYSRIVSLLLSKGANVHVLDGEYGSALLAALAGDNMETVMILEKWGARQ
ncbi:MAG: hypothetical protein M1820_005005 [Bogoriella megaspora]|nr:MAG: hypothetical protein M1820_005005 [Bogoriella megaspora]